MFLKELEFEQFNRLEPRFSRSIETVERDLQTFMELLQKWQKVQNLVSRETLDQLWDRHILDSLQLLPNMDKHQKRIIDFGSGGGFPAVPLAIACKGDGRNFTLVESNKRKASFLKAASRELGLNLRVCAQRVERIDPAHIGQIDLVTSRATTSLDRLLEMSFSFWSENTKALFHKGAEFRVELEDCSANWLFDVLSISSITSDSGRVLEISNLKKTS